jgi:hypothetical protein
MLMRGKPVYPGFWPDDTPGPDLEYGDNPVVVSTDATGYDRDKRYVLNSNLGFDIFIPWMPGLHINTNASFDKDFRFRKRFETPWRLYSWDGRTYDENNNPVLIKGKKGFEDLRLQEWMEDNQTVLLNGIIDYSYKWEQHGVKAMAGMESRARSEDNFNAYRRYFISTSIDELFAGGDRDKNNNGSSFENARLNYFGRLNYNYSEKYLFEFVVERNSFAECITFISEECDKAASLLPLRHETAHLGRATKGAALALIARVLLYAASELFHNIMGGKLCSSRVDQCIIQTEFYEQPDGTWAGGLSLCLKTKDILT